MTSRWPLTLASVSFVGELVRGLDPVIYCVVGITALAGVFFLNLLSLMVSLEARRPADGDDD